MDSAIGTKKMDRIPPSCDSKINTTTPISDEKTHLVALHENRRQKEATRLAAMAKFERYALEYDAAGKNLLQATAEVQEIVGNDWNNLLGVNTDLNLGGRNRCCQSTGT